MTDLTPRPPRRAHLAALCLLPLLMLPGLARAACGSWGGQNDLPLLLQMPASLTLTPQTATGDVLAKGNESLTALTCDGVASIDWQWGSGSDAGSNLRQLAPGIGLRLQWTATNGQTGWLPSGSSSATTPGFDWTNLHWELVRIAGTVTSGQSVSGGYVAAGTLFNAADNTQRHIIVNLSNSVPVVATCALSVDKSLVVLPDTDATALSTDGTSASTSLKAFVTCPADTSLSAGTSITLATALADTTDNTLVGNGGTAKGLAIEVLDGNSSRVSAQNGVVKQAAFTQGSSSAAPGTSQALSVRMAHLSGQPVIPGTVQGTFTLTLTVN